MLLKCCTQYVIKFGKLSSGHSTGKGQFSFQSQRRSMPKNVQTTAQLCSFHMVVSKWSKSFKLGFSSTWTENFQMHEVGSKRQKDQRSNCQHLLDHRKTREFQKNIYFCFIDYAKAFDYVDHNKLWKIQEMEIPASWEVCMQVKKQHLEPDMEEQTGSKLGKSMSRLYVVTLLI